MSQNTARDQAVATQTIECTIEFVLYVRDDGTTVVRAQTDARTNVPAAARELSGERNGSGESADSSFAAAGLALAGARPGETLALGGTWIQHPRYGLRFAVQTADRLRPASVRAIQRYLGSGLVRGIGPQLAAAITEQFGEQTLEVIDHSPERLAEVFGIGRRRTRMITESWLTHKAIRDLMVALRGFGVSPLLAERLYRAFGENALSTLTSSPYRLVGEIDGIGFLTADRIALAGGIPLGSPQRMEAAVWEVAAQRARQAGHCHLSVVEVVRQSAELVGQDPALVRAAVDRLAAGRGAQLILLDHPVTGTPLAAPRSLYRAETRVARMLAALSAAESDLPKAVLRKFEAGDFESAPREAGAEVAAANGSEPVDEGVPRAQPLHPGQLAAVRMALTQPVSIITGGPGCGKSHTVRTVVELVRAGGGSVTLAAPTGKAARRLSELTGAPAMTVHRLAADPHPASGNSGFGFGAGGGSGAGTGPGPGKGSGPGNGSGPGSGSGSAAAAAPQDGLDTLFGPRTTMVHLIVVDEASMLDTQLAARLIEKIPQGTHLLLVGDTGQLPSVGPGTVLADLLSVPGIARTELTHVFRQAAESTIIANAHRIRTGQLPQTRRSDFWFEALDDPRAIAHLCVQIATDRLPAKLGVTPDEVQVLSPTRRGPAGTVDLGRLLQEQRNPRTENEPEYWSGARVFRVGDRVMATRNDYGKGEHGIFNGTLGTVVNLDLKEGRLEVHTDDGDYAGYEFDELDDLTHAYAISVHKAQGSEFPHIVAPITMDAPLLLTRRLLYTMVTRAQRTVVLVGQPRALQLALDTTGPHRNTLLDYLLADAMSART
ncbi:MAG TPA: AAA family ATPase [Actinocrinis sp.]|nr:AAA family ATPase [Actinocrinis sp.]